MSASTRRCSGSGPAARDRQPDLPHRGGRRAGGGRRRQPFRVPGDRDRAGGSGFANTVIQYDGLTGGALFDAADLPPFSLQLDEFDMEFVEAGAQRGSPEDFEATVRFTREPGAAEETRTIRVNQPLEDRRHPHPHPQSGLAPLITVRDAEGTVLAEGAVPFLPQDNSFTSVGVRKVPVGPNMGSERTWAFRGCSFRRLCSTSRARVQRSPSRATRPVPDGVPRRSRSRRRTAAVGLPARHL